MPRRGDRLLLCAAYCILRRCLVTRLQAPCRPFFIQTVGNGNHRPVSPARLSAYKTSCSVPTSRFAVISSSSRIDGFAATARAMDKSCHCPCENSASVQGVSYPCSIPAITSCSPASFAASTASSLEIIGSESVICSRTVPGTRLKLCSTQPNRRRLILSGSR